MDIKEYYGTLESMEIEHAKNVNMLNHELASYPINLYRKKLDLLLYTFEKGKVDLMIKFANSHNTYKVGDSISDEKNTIIIRYIGYYKPNDTNLPLLCKYGGNTSENEFKVILTENLTHGNYIKENQTN